MITGFDHIQLAIPPHSENEARQFYGELLGLSEVAKPGALVERGGCWFEGPKIALHLGVQDDFVPAHKAHPAFLVTDLAVWRQRLAEAGIAVRLDETVPGVERFYAPDPFGNRLEFIQEGTGFSQQGPTS
jgi:catechol 2,3-dioxygenase-like lactoylglutathione lyase family enzyme